ncbi:DUF937 domain-containing protein [Altericroceibacterium xinjiangense]|uniref:DUF937 domain-containing protein n=1 Tax=Altericroceibacterium xinjiangense TaxID=762261 RepID=UPI000F7E36AD|nr:DUF937 domain-containing protein [Altericroceibacterium xinjiangense]
MNLDELLPPGGIDALAGQLGISHDKARTGAAALLPSILSGMNQRAGGAGNLESEVHSLGGAQLAHNVTGPQPTDVSKGNALLGSLFGGKDTSRQVAGQAAQTSGLDAGLLKRMLPVLTMLVAGHLSQRAGGQQGGLGGVLGSVVGGLGSGAGGGALGSGGLGGMLGSVLGKR